MKWGGVSMSLSEIAQEESLFESMAVLEEKAALG
jgi:hypothetical protein